MMLRSFASLVEDDPMQLLHSLPQGSHAADLLMTDFKARIDAGSATATVEGVFSVSLPGLLQLELALVLKAE